MELKEILGKLVKEFDDEFGYFDHLADEILMADANDFLRKILTEAYEAGINKKDGQIETYAQYHFKEGFQSAIQRVKEIIPNKKTSVADSVEWPSGEIHTAKWKEGWTAAITEILYLLSTLQQEE